MNNDIQTNAKIIADAILCDKTPDSLAEQVQELLCFVSDYKTQYTYATDLAQAILDFVFEAATPEQVIL